MTPKHVTVIRHGKTAPTRGKRTKLVPNDVTATNCLIYNGKVRTTLGSTSRKTNETVSHRGTGSDFARSTLGGLLSRTKIALVNKDIRRVPLTCGSVSEIVCARRALIRIRNGFVPHVIQVGGR